MTSHHHGNHGQWLFHSFFFQSFVLAGFGSSGTSLASQGNQSDQENKDLSRTSGAFFDVGTSPAWGSKVVGGFCLSAGPADPEEPLETVLDPVSGGKT